MSCLFAKSSSEISDKYMRLFIKKTDTVYKKCTEISDRIYRKNKEQIKTYSEEIREAEESILLVC